MRGGRRRMWRTDETGGLSSAMVAVSLHLYRNSSGEKVEQQGEEDGAAAASDFRTEDEMGLNFTL